MNAKQLINLLRNLDPTTPIMIPGYEGGYNAVQSIDLKPVKRLTPCTYMGDYDDCPRDEGKMVAVITNMPA